VTARPRGALERAARHPWIVLALFAAIYGVQTTGLPQFRIAAPAPFTTMLGPDDQFNYGSPLTLVLGSYYIHHGIPDAWAFAIVNTIGLLFCAAALEAYVSRRFPPDRRGTALLVAMTSPLLFVLLSWVGKSDPYLIAFFLLSSLTPSAGTRALLCACAVLCHQTLGAAILLAGLCFEPAPWRSVVAGVLAGEALVWLYAHVLLTSVPVSRAEYALDHLRELATILWRHPALHLWATLGPFWVFAIGQRRLITGTRTLVFAAAVALAAASFDFTRVFVIIAFPLVLDVTRELVASGSRIVTAWPLLFLQVQCAASRLLFAQGVRVRI